MTGSRKGNAPKWREKMGRKHYRFGTEAAETTKDLAKDIDRLKPIPEDELKKLLPERTEQMQLQELIEAVHAETDWNKKAAILNERLEIVAAGVKDVVLKILAGAIKLV
jgi:methionine salvage enolase-phosphatase E1